MKAAAASACALQLLHASCLQATAFGVDVDAEDRDTHARSLERLSAAGAVEPPFAFAALADTHDAYDDLEGTVAAINDRPGIHFVAHGGDMSDRGLLAELEWTKRELDRLDVPYLTAIGNHDTLSRGKEIYLQMFGPYDYSLVYGGVKLVFYNSNTLDFGGEAPRRDWLRGEAADLRGAGRLILVAHQPPHQPDDLAGGDARAFYEAIADDFDVTLWIHGHLHEWRLDRFRDDVVLGSAAEAHHAVVTILEDGIRIERCVLARCEEVPVPVGSPGP